MAIMNARPLIPVSNDLETPEVLSPAMLLTQKAAAVPTPPGDFELKDLYKVQWRQVQGLADCFWKRWRQEYLHTLQTRQKWKGERRNVKEGGDVLMKDNQVKRNEWPIGIVVKAIPSGENRVRKVEINIVKQGPCLIRSNYAAVYTTSITQHSTFILIIETTSFIPSGGRAATLGSQVRQDVGSSVDVLCPSCQPLTITSSIKLWFLPVYDANLGGDRIDCWRAERRATLRVTEKLGPKTTANIVNMQELEYTPVIHPSLHPSIHPSSLCPSLPPILYLSETQIHELPRRADMGFTLDSSQTRDLNLFVAKKMEVDLNKSGRNDRSGSVSTGKEQQVQRNLATAENGSQIDRGSGGIELDPGRGPIPLTFLWGVRLGRGKRLGVISTVSQSFHLHVFEAGQHNGMEDVLLKKGRRRLEYSQVQIEQEVESTLRPISLAIDWWSTSASEKQLFFPMDFHVTTMTDCKYPSFLKAKVVRDKRTGKTKGYAFVGFKDPNDNMREMNGNRTSTRLLLISTFIPTDTFPAPSALLHLKALLHHQYSDPGEDNPELRPNRSPALGDPQFTSLLP
ncbi:hypothetical protein CCH79_00009293, partial [Gambusia affinis]